MELCEHVRVLLPFNRQCSAVPKRRTTLLRANGSQFNIQHSTFNIQHFAFRSRPMFCTGDPKGAAYAGHFCPLPSAFRPPRHGEPMYRLTSNTPSFVFLPTRTFALASSLPGVSMRTPVDSSIFLLLSCISVAPLF